MLLIRMYLERMGKFAFAGLGLLTAATAAAAQAPAERTHLLSVSAGYFDILDNANDSAIDQRVEFRPDVAFLVDTPMFQLKPFVGLEATNDGMFYALAGILLDVSLGDRFVLTPSFGAGVYADGDGPDLGHTIEFRAQLELGYRFANESRISAAFSHISNASLGDQNPGVEILSIYYHFPLRAIAGD